MTVLIAGGGIAGMAMALTCHEIGVPFRVFEAVKQIRPLGVGINLQPVAVRELEDMGLAGALEAIGVRTQEVGFYSRHGVEIWTEPRGTWAGYKWPQFSVHRGELLIMLWEALKARAGADIVETGWRATGFANRNGAAVLHLVNEAGETRDEVGDLVIAADGIHSAIRAQMQPEEGPPAWGGNILWRGTTQAKPFKTGGSMVMIGYSGLRFISYPISKPDPETGLATINWIANLKTDPGEGFKKEDWNRKANLDDFLPQYRHFNLDWIDIPGLIEGAEEVLEYPMVDRDPIDRWTEGRVTLMGDAAHPAYPTGSNGAGSAILDARRLGAAFLEHGLTQDALEAYEADMRPVTAAVTLANRSTGPDSILDIVERVSGGKNFAHIHEVMSQEDLAAHAESYKQTAGTSVAAVNARPRTIAAGARFRG
ncbi:flavin-dependent oxidoreductase [Marimonas sp. MJW-29]|uniref:Flavin-dependent oxidoreductase n=1 Tax=Sulfitobacter sediminis TaxID=3234186 RepID=A0ABV3RUI4_9RHOB